MSKGWLRDFALGVRLAVGGGRTSWARLALGTVGIGMAALVLLIAASVGNISHVQQVRTLGSEPSSTPVAGVNPLRVTDSFVQFEGNDIQGMYLLRTGPHSPVPPGVSRLPGPNEVVVSQALADLLNSSAGALLRPRFPQRIVGVIDPMSVTQPSTMRFYAGVSSFGANANLADYQPIYSFSQAQPPQASEDYTLLTVALVGAVVILVPILIFVAMSSRIAGAQRDRRLAALRLVGAGSRQVRRIAAAESLVSSAAGLVLGAVGFLIARQFAPAVDLFGWSAYPSDVVPSLPLIVLIVLVIPLLAVGASLSALRRTIIEPLGVVRIGRPVRRRLWWRLALIVVGIGALLSQTRNDSGNAMFAVAVVGGAAALLIGVPVALPWLLERIVGAIRGGAPSWQLAIRRLQLDSGTPARVVGGVAVVLAGAIALQTVLLAAATRYDVPKAGAKQPAPAVLVDSAPSLLPQVAAAVRTAQGVRSVSSMRMIESRVNGTTAGNQDQYLSLAIASCATVNAVYPGGQCVDGEVFSAGSQARGRPVATVGTQVSVLSDGDGETPVGSWTLRSAPLTLPSNSSLTSDYFDLLITPGALAGAVLPPNVGTGRTIVQIDPNLPNATDYVANSVGPLTWQVTVNPIQGGLSTSQVEFVTMRNTLLAGSLFTLMLAGVSMLVLALEQVRERRRPIAVLAAAGAPRSVLARSLLWQTALPVAIGVVVAMGFGVGLAALVLRMLKISGTPDWGTMGIFSGAALALVLLVTAATLPSLRGATRLSALRTE